MNNDGVLRRICRPTITAAGCRLPSYAVMLYLGCIAGVVAGSLLGSAWGAPADRIAVAAIALIAVALIGSRMLYVTTHFSLFRQAPSRLLRRLDGGGALYGGLLLAIAASPAVLFLLNLRFLAFWDAASVIMLVGLAITKVGCLMRGCCAGRPTAGRFGVRLPDHTGTWRRRVPSQLLETAWAIVVLVTVCAIHAAWQATGVVFGFSIALYGAGRVLLELTRLPDGSRWSRPVNIGMSLALVVCGCTLLAALAYGPSGLMAAA